VSTKSVMDTTGVLRRRNRSWPAAFKREIVAASSAPGASVAVVARRYEVNANQLFVWRRLYRDGSLASADAGAPSMVPVRVTPEHRRDAVATTSAAHLIAIELAYRYRIRVGSGVDVNALRVLDVLELRRSRFRRAYGSGWRSAGLTCA